MGSRFVSFARDCMELRNTCALYTLAVGLLDVSGAPHTYEGITYKLTPTDTDLVREIEISSAAKETKKANSRVFSTFLSC